MERPPLDLNNLWKQVAENIYHCKKYVKPAEAPGITYMSDEQYARLMAPCKGPNDDPTNGDLH